MSKKLTTFGWLGLALVLASIPSCSDDSDDEKENIGTDAAEFECDPVGANKKMGKLLNAPVDDDVEIIVKKPKHPGSPGPLDLP